MRIFLIIFTFIVSLILLLFVWMLLFGPEQYYVFDPMIDTETSAGFSTEKFDKITVGMDSSEVKSIIGEPLFKQYDLEDSSILFQYTNDGKLLDQEIPWYLSSDYAWLGVDVHFDSFGKVSKKHSRWIYD